MALTMEQKNDLDFILKNLLAGGVAGMCAKTTVAPLDRMKILLQAQSSHYKNHGVLGGLTAIVKKESLIALYKGNGAQMVRIFPYAATQFTSFEIYKKVKGGLVLTVPGKLVCGGLAGAVAQSVSYPLDVTRRRMQLACMDAQTAKFGDISDCMTLSRGVGNTCRSTGMVKTLTLIYRENGVVKGLYRGMSINYIRAIPMVATSFSTYELMKQLLHLDTGMMVS
ncbi:hypothetical protein B5X24_HaOG209453 [Helicoverpa armigera]|uniref:Mitochondrial carrier protein n=1 Tax=Helicoverpa armigera TaxID=29058 RepID=A0A2W1BGY0_HELAM|nr:hypothetical protein B5X24_HaOG209453 [Helicoverpa armigera]